MQIIALLTGSCLHGIFTCHARFRVLYFVQQKEQRLDITIKLMVYLIVINF
jgi:hypothetical protein